jgi:hypothetical protein
MEKHVGKNEKDLMMVAPETPKDREINLIGRAIKSRLDMHNSQWQGGLLYKIILSPLATRVRKIGMDTTELATELQKRGYLRVIGTPDGSRYVFSGTSEMTPDEMLEWVIQREEDRRTIRDHKKSNG